MNFKEVCNKMGMGIVKDTHSHFNILICSLPDQRYIALFVELRTIIG